MKNVILETETELILKQKKKTGHYRNEKTRNIFRVNIYNLIVNFYVTFYDIEWLFYIMHF